MSDTQQQQDLRQEIIDEINASAPDTSDLSDEHQEFLKGLQGDFLENYAPDPEDTLSDLLDETIENGDAELINFIYKEFIPYGVIEEDRTIGAESEEDVLTIKSDAAAGIVTATYSTEFLTRRSVIQSAASDILDNRQQFIAQLEDSIDDPEELDKERVKGIRHYLSSVTESMHNNNDAKLSLVATLLSGNEGFAEEHHLLNTTVGNTETVSAVSERSLRFIGGKESDPVKPVWLVNGFSVSLKDTNALDDEHEEYEDAVIVTLTTTLTFKVLGDELPTRLFSTDLNDDEKLAAVADELLTGDSHDTVFNMVPEDSTERESGTYRGYVVYSIDQGPVFAMAGWEDILAVNLNLHRYLGSNEKDISLDYGLDAITTVNAEAFPVGTNVQYHVQSETYADLETGKKKAHRSHKGNAGPYEAVTDHATWNVGFTLTSNYEDGVPGDRVIIQVSVVKIG